MHAQIVPDHLVTSLHQLNRAYLHTARDVVRCGQDELVAALFGLDELLAHWLAEATPEAIERLATTPGMLFQPRLPAETSRLLAVCTQAPERDITALHLLLRNLGGGDVGQTAHQENKPETKNKPQTGHATKQAIKQAIKRANQERPKQ